MPPSVRKGRPIFGMEERQLKTFGMLLEVTLDNLCDFQKKSVENHVK